VFHHSFRRRATAIGLAVAAAATLTGCLPDVSMSPGVSAPEPAAATTHSTTRPSVVPAAAPARPVGDLDTGTATHKQAAGDRTVVIDYWTDEAAAEWTAADTKTVQVSAHLEDDTSKQTVLVTRFVATADDGTTRTTVTEDRGEFAITPPFSYGTVLSLQPAAAHAERLTVYVQLELLVETERNSGRYFRQTVLDSLVLPLIKEDRK
jgi:hypothetical protein